MRKIIGCRLQKWLFTTGSKESLQTEHSDGTPRRVYWMDLEAINKETDNAQ